MTDEIDLHTVTVINSPPDVADWQPTATITRVDFRPSGVHVEHTKSDQWPNTPDESKWKPGDGVQYTLWMIAKVGDRWVTSGGIEFWKGCPENGGPPEQFGHNWYYAHDRWRELADVQPAPGTPTGFFLTQGDARDNGKHDLRERSNVIVVPFPSSGASYLASAPAPGESSPIPSEQRPAPPGSTDQNPPFVDLTQIFEQRHYALMGECLAIRNQLAELQKTIVTATGSIADQGTRFQAGLKAVKTIAAQLIAIANTSPSTTSTRVKSSTPPAARKKATK